MEEKKKGIKEKINDFYTLIFFNCTLFFLLGWIYLNTHKNEKNSAIGEQESSKISSQRKLKGKKQCREEAKIYYLVPFHFPIEKILRKRLQKNTGT